MSALLNYFRHSAVGLALVTSWVMVSNPAQADTPRSEHEDSVTWPAKMILPNLQSYPSVQAAEGPTWSRPSTKILPTKSLRFDPSWSGVWHVNQLGKVTNCTSPCTLAVSPGVVALEAFEGDTQIARKEVNIAGDETVFLTRPGPLWVLSGGLLLVTGGVFGLVAALGESSSNNTLYGTFGVVFGVGGLVMLARGLVMDPAIIIKKVDGNFASGGHDRTPSPRPWIGFSSAGLGAGVTF
jgi:hypothetical protein